MTVLGKILVFINLVFSLLTGGLIVMVFLTRAQWNDAFKKQQDAYKIAVAQAQADVKAVQDQVQATLDQDKLAVQNAQKVLDDANASRAAAQASLDASNQSDTVAVQNAQQGLSTAQASLAAVPIPFRNWPCLPIRIAF